MGALRYNTGKLKWSLVSWRALSLMVEVLMYGAHKYSVFEDNNGNIVTGAEISPDASKKLKQLSSGANNWKNGLKWTECAESLQRHLISFLEGQDDDEESKLSHIGHIMCNAMFLGWMSFFRKDLDDRLPVADVEVKKEG